MSAIPDEIMDEAKMLRNTVLWASNSSIEAISLAILAAEQRGAERERERAAKIADAHSECERDCGDVIAAAIRNTKG
jgi:hypothetical protein